MAGLLQPYKGVMPRIAPDAFIADGAQLIGDIEIASRANIWFNCVIRGDEQAVTIGANTNVQDGTVIHVHSLKQGTYIGANVTIGHKVMLHGCEIGDNSLVGINAVVLNRAKIGRNCLIGANALITEGKEIPDNSLVMGSPGRVIRELNEQEIAGLTMSAKHYVENARRFRAGLVVQSEADLLQYALERLKAIDGVSIVGRPDIGIVSFAVSRAHPHDLATLLDEHGIAIRAGHHCAQPYLARLGYNATNRISLSPYNTREEIDALADRLPEVIRLLMG